MTFLALTGGAAFGTLQFVALQYTTAINMGVVGSVAPAFIVAASFLLFGDRMGLRSCPASPISLVGRAGHRHPAAAGARCSSLSFNIGDLLIITNMVLWAIYCACLRLRPDVHPMSFLFVLSLVVADRQSAVRAVGICVRLPSGRRHRDDAGAILYAAVFTTLLAYVTWNRGVDLVGAPRASAFLHTIPLFSTTLATSFLGEQLKLYHVVGFALILAGVTLAARPAAQRSTSPRAAAQRQRRIVRCRRSVRL